jgi:hypothetical protein
MDMWYRYEDFRYYEGGTRVELIRLKVIKKTDCGVWISPVNFELRRWVKRNARKRYACPTKQEALESFIARKKRQIEILSVQLHNAQSALNIGESMQKEEQVDGRSI